MWPCLPPGRLHLELTRLAATPRACSPLSACWSARRGFAAGRPNVRGAKRVFNCGEQIIEKFTINPFLWPSNSLGVEKFVAPDARVGGQAGAFHYRTPAGIKVGTPNVRPTIVAMFDQKSLQKCSTKNRCNVQPKIVAGRNFSPPNVRPTIVAMFRQNTPRTTKIVSPAPRAEP